MYPHERSLVTKLKDKDFVLLGVNSDSRGRLRKAIKRNKMTWRSWWDNGSTRGPISRRWGISAWPSTYIFDQKGAIRFKGLRGDDLDKAIDQLLAEMTKKAKAPQ
jgi:peroxiredoxin